MKRFIQLTIYKNRILLLIIILSLSTGKAYSQIIAPAFPADSSYVNTVSLGSDYGISLNRKADYLSFTSAYSRKITTKWVLSGGIAYGHTMEVVDKEREYTSAFSGMGKLSYFLTKRLSLSTGLVKGFIDNDNIDRKLKMNSGDWSTGLTVGVDLPEMALWEHDIYALSISYLYNISNEESIITFGIIIGGGW